MYLFLGLVDLDNIEKKLISLPSSSTGAERKEEDAPEEEAKDGHRSDLIIRRRCCMDDEASAFQNASPVGWIVVQTTLTNLDETVLVLPTLDVLMQPTRISAL